MLNRSLRKTIYQDSYNNAVTSGCICQDVLLEDTTIAYTYYMIHLLGERGDWNLAQSPYKVASLAVE